MNSIYRSLVIRAKNSIGEPPQLSEPAIEAVLRVMEPVLMFAKELRLEGLLGYDPQRIDSSLGVEVRWALPERKSLVIRGRGPVFNIRYRPRARIAAGVMNTEFADAWMPVYGSYLAPNSPKDGLRTHAVILECVADLVSVYRNGLDSHGANIRLYGDSRHTARQVSDDLLARGGDRSPFCEGNGVNDRIGSRGHRSLTQPGPGLD